MRAARESIFVSKTCARAICISVTSLRVALLSYNNIYFARVESRTSARNGDLRTALIFLSLSLLSLMK